MIKIIEKTESFKTNHPVNLFKPDFGINKERQKGAILIGLIVTMVIIASLGAGMVYLTSTSSFHELFSNNNARAYYAAESGGRYVLAVIRDAYAKQDMTLLNPINANQTFTLNSNQGNFQITNFMQIGTNPQTINFSSIGTVNSGFLQAKRQLNYSVQPAKQSTGSGDASRARRNDRRSSDPRGRRRCLYSNRFNGF